MFPTRLEDSAAREGCREGRGEAPREAYGEGVEFLERGGVKLELIAVETPEGGA